MSSAPRRGKHCDSWLPSPVRAGRVSGAIAVLLLAASSVASAQQYEADPVDEKARLLSGIVTSCVKDPSRYTSDKDRFLEYFEKFFFPSMTGFDADSLELIGKKRSQLFDALWKSRNPQLQSDLTKLAYEKMAPIVSPKATKRYHPAVRYNAMLVLGLLDEEYTNGSTPPKPLQSVNTSLLTPYVKAAAEGKRVEPSLLVGALVGLERHAQYHDALKGQALEVMTAAVLKLASLETPPPDVDRNVFEWIKFQSATVLANLGSPGPNNASHMALLKLLADRVMSVDGRCQTIALLEKIKYDGAKVDGKATADAVLQLAIEVGKAESKRATEFEDQQVVGGGYGGGRGMGEGGGRRQMSYSDEPIKFDRRTLLTRLDGLRRGLAAAKPLVSPDRQPAIDAVLAAVRTLIDQAQDADKVIDLDLANNIKTMNDQIRKAVNPAAPTPAAPAEEFAPL